MQRGRPAVGEPLRAGSRDIREMNRLFSEAFTERYRRDGMAGVRVPYLNPRVWEYAIENAAEGARLWRDSRGHLVAFNLSHCSGSEGWMGPIAVAVDRQGEGLGRTVVEDAIARLERQGASTIGLETMPRTVENIGFYSSLGFAPKRLTVTLQRAAREIEVDGLLELSRLPTGEADRYLDDCRATTRGVSVGPDYSREASITLRASLGDVTLRLVDGAVDAFAIWHGVPLADGRTRDDLRVLKLVARDVAGAKQLLNALESTARRRGLSNVTVRCQTEQEELYGRLVDDGWRVQWTDLRMTLAGRDEAPTRGVVLSNWEI